MALGSLDGLENVAVREVELFPARLLFELPLKVQLTVSCGEFTAKISNGQVSRRRGDVVFSEAEWLSMVADVESGWAGPAKWRMWCLSKRKTSLVFEGGTPRSTCKLTTKEVLAAYEVMVMDVRTALR
jgi:hypothetical protein